MESHQYSVPILCAAIELQYEHSHVQYLKRLFGADGDVANSRLPEKVREALKGVHGSTIVSSKYGHVYVIDNPWIVQWRVCSTLILILYCVLCCILFCILCCGVDFAFTNSSRTAEYIVCGNSRNQDA